MRFVCPLIVVTDIPRSVHFYRDLLGLRVKVDFGENVTFEGDFAIHLASHYSGLLGPEAGPITFGSHSGELYFETDDLESCERRLREQGVEFVHPLREEPWRQRVLRIHDPDRHLIEVGETLPELVRRLAGEGLTRSQIAQATLLPAEFVEGVLAQPCPESPTDEPTDGLTFPGCSDKLTSFP